MTSEMAAIGGITGAKTYYILENIQTGYGIQNIYGLKNIGSVSEVIITHRTTEDFDLPLALQTLFGILKTPLKRNSLGE